MSLLVESVCFSLPVFFYDHLSFKPWINWMKLLLYCLFKFVFIYAHNLSIPVKTVISYKFLNCNWKEALKVYIGSSVSLGITSEVMKHQQ